MPANIRAAIPNDIEQQLITATAEAYGAQSSAVNSLKATTWSPTICQDTCKACSACRPLELYRTTQELIRDEAIAKSALQRGDLVVQSFADMQHVAEQAGRGCLCCGFLIQVYEKTYAAKSVFRMAVDELVVRRSLDIHDATVLCFQTAGAYSLKVEVLYEPSE